MNKEQREQLERNIISAILGAPGGLHEVWRALKPEMFRTGFYRKVMQSILSCLSADIEVNLVNVATHGRFNPQENVGLCEIPLGGGDLQLLSKTLAEAVIVERFQVFKTQITEDADAFELLDELRKLDNETTALVTMNTRKDKLDLLSEFTDYLLGNAKDGVRRIATGFPTLDKMLKGGLEAGGFTLLGGTPGAGKTSLILSLALTAARKGTRVAFIEGEMTANEILERLNGIATGGDIDAIRKGKEYDALSRGFISELYDLPLEIVIATERTLDSLTAEIRRCVHEGSKLVFVDYLQVFAPKGKADDEFSQIKRVSETLRQIALKNAVHLCVCSSLNRSEANSERVTLNSFYGSSQLGHDCSVGLVLTGEQKDFQELVTPERDVALHVIKNRPGARGEVALKFHLASQRFDEMTAPTQPLERDNVFMER